VCGSGPKLIGCSGYGLLARRGGVGNHTVRDRENMRYRAKLAFIADTLLR
jgi:hypothetical protein